ncbi:hypothetical protein F8G81_02145 [Arthrobacter sp. CDRTa11]|nr:hypothetical protein F8G81_02145 [Arthrobacter sp. CDRTa11]
MRSGLTICDFPVPRKRVTSGAGDEEVFETEASPPAVAGPLTSSLTSSRQAHFKNRMPATRPVPHA